MKGYIMSIQDSLFGKGDVIGFGDDNFRVMEISRDMANSVIKKNHYSKKFYNASYIHLGIYKGEDMMGVLQYGYAMNPASASAVVKNTGMREYLELNRMWLDDILPRNSESMAISYSIKYIKRKYNTVKWIQSFADERCKCFGVVYQAANFKYFGEHNAIFWNLDGIVYHNSLMTRNPLMSKSAALLQENKERATCETLRQFRYIYFIKKWAEKDCCLKQKEYPKHGESE